MSGPRDRPARRQTTLRRLGAEMALRRTELARLRGEQLRCWAVLAARPDATPPTQRAACRERYLALERAARQVSDGLRSVQGQAFALAVDLVPELGEAAWMPLLVAESAAAVHAAAVHVAARPGA